MVVSTDDYTKDLTAYFTMFPDRFEDFLKNIKKYQFTDYIPKLKCFIKLNPDITAA